MKFDKNADDNKDSFEYFANCLESMKSNYRSELVLIAFLNYFLTKHGSSLNVDECVSCGNKNGIIKFSFETGGYLCKKCCNSLNDDIEYLRNVRILAKVNYENIVKVDVDSVYTYKYIKEVISLIESKLGIYFKSKMFLLRVLKGEN